MESTTESGDTPLMRLLRAATRRLSRQTGLDLDLATVAADAGVDVEVARTLFLDTTALLRMVGETAMQRQLDVITRTVAKASPDDPAAQFMAIGHGVLDWAMQDPDCYRVMHSPLMRRLQDDETIHRYTASIRSLGRQFLERAQAAGQIAPDFDIGLFHIGALATTYGFARIAIDGHLRHWDVQKEDIGRVLHAAMAQLGEGIFVPRPR